MSELLLVPEDDERHLFQDQPDKKEPICKSCLNSGRGLFGKVCICQYGSELMLDCLDSDVNMDTPNGE